MVTLNLVDRPRGTSRPYRPLGRRIAALREAAGLSGREVARRVPMSEGYIGQIEGGIRRPDPGLLWRIASVIGTTYEDLAVLAGYARPLEGDEALIAAPADDLPLRARAANLPSAVLRRFMHLYDLASQHDDRVLREMLGLSDENENERGAGASGR